MTRRPTRSRLGPAVVRCVLERRNADYSWHWRAYEDGPRGPAEVGELTAWRVPGAPRDPVANAAPVQALRINWLMANAGHVGRGIGRQLLEACVADLRRLAPGAYLVFEQITSHGTRRLIERVVGPLRLGRGPADPGAARPEADAWLTLPARSPARPSGDGGWCIGTTAEKVTAWAPVPPAATTPTILPSGASAHVS